MYVSVPTSSTRPSSPQPLHIIPDSSDASSPFTLRPTVRDGLRVWSCFRSDVGASAGPLPWASPRAGEHGSVGLLGLEMYDARGDEKVDTGFRQRSPDWCDDLTSDPDDIRSSGPGTKARARTS